VHGMHAATSKVEYSAQGSSCQLKFVHGQFQNLQLLFPAFKLVVICLIFKYSVSLISLNTLASSLPFLYKLCASCSNKSVLNWTCLYEFNTISMQMTATLGGTT
jgi:hypothetical protein